ncbi:MAG TPA: deoxyribose-phosphate aldolase, partial [Acidobacteriota bacterium]|nr:deoxyribose-phosphate aldolase [Acidobacteriota bacterium]
MKTNSMTDKPRRIVTRADIDQATGELVLPTGTIVTPSAMELADRKGVVITFADRPSEPEAKTCDPVTRPRDDIAAVIDHTNLSPGATRDDIVILCREAVEYGFATVCVAPNRTAAAVAELTESTIHVCGVAGFPMGANTTETKAAEAAQCIAAGAREIDMVAATGLLRDGDWLAYRDDIAAVRQAIGPDVVLKVIIETNLLDESDLVRAAILAAEAGACYVKTATGV